MFWIYFCLIILVVVLCLICVKLSRNGIEMFTSNMTLKDVPEASQKRTFGIESCDILKTDDETIGNAEYNMMTTMLGGFRLNKWKPVDDGMKNPGRDYCYLYNDRPSNISDYMTSLGGCDTNNPLFKNNPMITRIFEDSTEDKTHILPVKKCVLELDVNMITPSSINAFWRQWGSSGTHCDNLTGDLRGELSNVRVKYHDVESKYNRLVGADQALSERNRVLESDLLACGACNQVWSGVIGSEWEAITEEEAALSQEKRLFNAYTGSNTVLRTDTTAKRAERDNWRDLWGSQSNVYYPCTGSLSECRVQESQASSNYQAVLTINRGLTACNQNLSTNRNWFMSGFNQLNESLTVCDGVRVEETDKKTSKYNDLLKVTDWYHTCDLERGHFFNAYGTFSNLYRDSFSNYNVCVRDRNALNDTLASTRRNKLNCESERGSVEQRNIQTQRELSKREQALEQAKNDLRQARDAYFQCNNQRERLKSTKENLLVTNVELYNELEAAYQRMRKAQKTAFEDQRYVIEESLLDVGKGCEANGAEIGDLQKQVQLLMQLPENKTDNVCGTCMVTQEQCAIYEKDAVFCANPTDRKKIEEQDKKDGVPN